MKSETRHEAPDGPRAAGTPLIATGSLAQDSLAGHVAVVTGAGGGIGYEAARALLWLGARVVIAEINHRAGQEATRRLAAEYGDARVLFVHADVGDERSANQIARKARRVFGAVDIVINNATIAPLGPVQDVPIRVWDASYRVNLRGPVLLARTFVPAMVERRWGVFVCVSSVGQAYMAAYEAMKAAQVHLGATLDAELEGTGVVAFTIGPGFVPTGTATAAISRLAELMGQPLDELQSILVAHTISVEAAGAGFAAAVAQAERYRGQEISSVQALVDAGIRVPEADADGTLRVGTRAVRVAEADADETSAVRGEVSGSLKAIAPVVHGVRTTLAEQAAGWQERNLFERQWMIRTFRSDARMPVDAWLAALDALERAAAAGDVAAVGTVKAPLDALAGFYRHQYDLAKGYVKDAAEREKTLAIVQAWVDEVERLRELMRSL